MPQVQQSHQQFLLTLLRAVTVVEMEAMILVQGEMVRDHRKQTKVWSWTPAG